jgi:hypothetical protein
MKDLSPPDARQLGLEKYAKIVHQFGGYPFFGTALGIIRNGSVLPQDDDVDFILPFSSRKKLIDKLVQESSIRFKLVTDWIVQTSFTESREEILLDFYFFWDEGPDVRLPWNFYGTPWRPETHLLVPKRILSELVTSSSGNFVASGDSIARYLYGDRWTEPMTKGIDYEIRLMKNRPRYIYPGPIGRFARKRVLNLEGRKSTINDFLRRMWLIVVMNPIGFFRQIRDFKTNQRHEIVMLRDSDSEVLKLNSEKS